MENKNSEPKPKHVPVLLNEVIAGLALAPGQAVVDGTVGLGGHAAAILERTAPDGRLLGLDRDEAALDAARSQLGRFGSRVMLVRASYRDVRRVLLTHAFGPVQAALLDLGFSSLEIDDPTRGFSFRADGPLDMRFDRDQELTAAEIVNHESAEELSKMIWDFGEERFSRSIARAIVAARKTQPIVGTLALAEIIGGAVPGWYRRGRLHPATRTFQALRIAVNDELGCLRAALPEFLEALAPGGRLAVISFHSLEDRIVKNYFNEAAEQGRASVLTRRPIVAADEENAANPRARSAKLRLLRKIA
ncbi:16S rRNA (cytosine(1402)-N(4))-methyltransferase [Candidatus Uhrbacteria bacterium RIFCSPHIGHO2_02_FULL_60_10]|uniref:Ribosomal RNA small subunit methyltransferase H n=1 Tax=Candidatus Uhrbacteria bacterium RIFCSPHIGHO2_02_FULL_60_10 TaxID=1802392 RepID=A0A1F7UA27_9BACT|nr:MAG: 16S rRNA (cytosine(1402)-N(4))-methyltransferase [Candidatus Uhrbacteria bacterium RIFCSPHIGHO2_02_FULL_60_10]